WRRDLSKVFLIEERERRRVVRVDLISHHQCKADVLCLEQLPRRVQHRLDFLQRLSLGRKRLMTGKRRERPSRGWLRRLRFEGRRRNALAPTKQMNVVARIRVELRQRPRAGVVRRGISLDDVPLYEVSVRTTPP